MFKKFYLLLLITAFFICLSTVTANADIIFSDIPSSGNLYDASSALGALGKDIVNPYGPNTPAAQFTAGGTGSIDVTQIDVAVDARFANTYPGTFQVQIWTSSSNIPGTALYTSGNLTPIGVYGSQHGLVPISGITGLSLIGGQPYFISVNVVDNNGDASWYRNVFPAPPNQTTGLVLLYSPLNNVQNGPLVWNVIGNPGYLPAFDILGSAPPVTAPEPTTMLLLGLGLVGLAGVRRKFKQ
jgi:hypothetical protein